MTWNAWLPYIWPTEWSFLFDNSPYGVLKIIETLIFFKFCSLLNIYLLYLCFVSYGFPIAQLSKLSSWYFFFFFPRKKTWRFRFDALFLAYVFQNLKDRGKVTLNEDPIKICVPWERISRSFFFYLCKISSGKFYQRFLKTTKFTQPFFCVFFFFFSL